MLLVVECKHIFPVRRCHITSVTRSSRHNDHQIGVHAGVAMATAALAPVSLGGVGDKSDDRQGDERGCCCCCWPGIHTFHRSIAEQSIQQRNTVRPAGRLTRPRGLVMLPGKGIGDDARVRSTYCLITIAIAISIVRRKHCRQSASDAALLACIPVQLQQLLQQLGRHSYTSSSSLHVRVTISTHFARLKKVKATLINVNN